MEHKLQSLLQNTIVGESRQSTILLTTGSADYVLEVGDGRQAPNAGLIQRLRFYGAADNRACLHLNLLCHMWRLEELLFSGGACPALIVDNCWDSNYTDIDILGHAGTAADPARGAAVILRNGSANLYLRGLRVEGARSGGLYVDSGPIYVVTGKIDDGFGQPQTAAAITVAADGHLVLDDFYIGGIRDQFHIDVAGTLKLGFVVLDGGSNSVAAINDRRAWQHADPHTRPGISAAATGPHLPLLDLGAAQFNRSHPSVSTETAAAVFSRIHPIRRVRQLAVSANGPVSENTRRVRTSVSAAQDDLHTGCFLVHNSSGTEAGAGPGARRRILRSYAKGELLLQGAQPVLLDADWSIEYCAAHCTPLRAHRLWLEGQELFHVLARNVRASSRPEYVHASGDAAYGTTRFAAMGLARGKDLTGLFLVDEQTGEPFYIEYGIDAEGIIGTLYDRRAALSSARRFSVVAGYAANVQTAGEWIRWNFAGRQHCARQSALREAGYDPQQPPLWGFGAGGALVAVAVADMHARVDLAAGTEFIIASNNQDAFLIMDPANGNDLAGERIGVTISNVSRGALGTVTWGEHYRLASWINPEAGTSRSIEFRYDGRFWIEVARTPADVPN